jgi:anti-sigma B factor antagonist
MEATSDGARGAAATVLEMPGVVVLQLHGNIDRSATGSLTTAYEQGLGGQTGAERSRVVLDFSDADYINSSGIALVVSVLARARAEGRAVAATGLTDHYRHIFDITRLSDFIEVCADLETAVGSPAGSH